MKNARDLSWPHENNNGIFSAHTSRVKQRADEGTITVLWLDWVVRAGRLIETNASSRQLSQISGKEEWNPRPSCPQTVVSTNQPWDLMCSPPSGSGVGKTGDMQFDWEGPMQ